MAVAVTTDNFVRAETDRMFAALAAQSGGINRWAHNRRPTPFDQQPVIRMNRDTLYSSALVDLSGGASLTIPDAGDRYLSVMVVNQDHYINEVLHGPEHELTQATFDTPYVDLAARMLVDASDPTDLAAGAAIQDGLRIEAASTHPFEPADYDVASLDAARDGHAQLAAGGLVASRMFGRREDVDPEKHLDGTAGGWGGLPQTEATYIGGPADPPVGEYRLTLRDVPVDAFWSSASTTRTATSSPTAAAPTTSTA